MEHPTNTISLDRLKRRAKARAKEAGISHSKALDELAREAGSPSYRAFQSAAPEPKKRFAGVRRSATPTQLALVAIELLDAPIPITRHLVVPAFLNMEQLHGIIQIAMCWEKAHLYCFDVGDEGSEIVGRFDDVGERDARHHGKYVNAELVRLRELLDEGKQEAAYVYDFGDNWRHRVTFEYVEATWVDPEEGVVLLNARGICPPEDCGGISRFRDLAAMFGDVSGREEVSRTYGPSYDPFGKVELAKVQQQLERWGKTGFDPDMLYVPDMRLGGLNPNAAYR